MSEQETDALRRERVLTDALESILASLDGELIGAQRLRGTIRETANSALREAGMILSD